MAELFSKDSILHALARLETESAMDSWYQRRVELGKEPGKNWRELLRAFLSSTMDETRSRRATDLAHETLARHAFSEATFFRDAVLRREVSGDMEYSKQRDHSAHTINNWLLGWLFYEHCTAVKDAMGQAIAQRGLTKDATRLHLDLRFGDLWLYVSLLHDIGYLFEGSIAPLSWRDQHGQAGRAALFVDDFFQHQIWSEWGIRSNAQKTAIVDATGYRENWPSMSRSGSLGSIASFLRRLGPLEKILLRLNIDGNQYERDAFDLWSLHYEKFESSGVPRVDFVRKKFDEFVYSGLPGLGVRVIDHGVASGLLLLQTTTRYYSVLFHNETKRPNSSVNEEEWRRFIAASAEAGSSLNWTLEFWWKGIVWATFAAALHNVVQQGGDKLRLEEEPLGYLGTMVDILQEWDRYSVGRTAHIVGRASLQGIDVPVSIHEGKIHIQLGERASDVASSLSKCLYDWERFVVIT